MTRGAEAGKEKLVNVIAELAKFADEYKSTADAGFTHFQPAQPTTVGKRATLWMQEFLLDLEDVDYVLNGMKLLGSKGTTGTQASFLELFDGDHEKNRRIDPMIAKKMGFKDCYPVSGQTYSRKVDTRVVNVLAGIAASAHKFSNDIRLLQHLKEVEEPFEKSQIGSSAMAYKRILREANVSRHSPDLSWQTRSTRRSHPRRSGSRERWTIQPTRGWSIPEGFSPSTAFWTSRLNVVDGLVVYPKVIEASDVGTSVHGH